MNQIVVNVRKEISVFEIRQYQQIDNNAHRQKQFLFGNCCRTVNTFSQCEIGQRGKNQNKDKQSACLEIEEQTHGKQKRIAQQSTIINHAECGKNKSEKRPEVELCEQ
jgi:hypothetical protein